MTISPKLAAVDVADDAVRIAVVQTGRQPKVIESVHIDVVHAEGSNIEEARLVASRRAIEALKSEPALFVLAARTEWAVVRVLRVPFKGRRRVAAAVPFELEPFLAFPVEEVVTAHRVLREVDGQTEVLVIGVRRNELASRADVLKEAGVRVEGIGLDAVGLDALLLANHGAGKATHCAVHLGNSEALLTIGTGKNLRYIQRLPISADRATADPSGFARTVKNALRSYASGTPDTANPDSITVTGPTLDTETLAALESDWDAPTKSANLSGALPKKIGGELSSYDSAETMVAGVALSAAGSPNYMDFIAGLDAERSFAPDVVSRGIAASMLLAGLVLAYLLLTALDYHNNHKEMDEIGLAISKIYDELYPSAPGAGEPLLDDPGGEKIYDALMVQIENETGGQREISLSDFTEPPLVDILAALATHCPESKVTLREIKFRGGRDRMFVIAGELREPTRLDDVVKGLESTGLFTFDKSRQKQEVKEGRQFFELSAAL